MVVGPRASRFEGWHTRPLDTTDDSRSLPATSASGLRGSKLEVLGVHWVPSGIWCVRTAVGLSLWETGGFGKAFTSDSLGPLLFGRMTVQGLAFGPLESLELLLLLGKLGDAGVLHPASGSDAYS